MQKIPITAKGQIVLSKDLLKHLDLKQGESVEVIKLPNGELKIRAEQPTHPISHAFDLLKNKTSGKVASIEELNQAIIAGWSANKN